MTALRPPEWLSRAVRNHGAVGLTCGDTGIARWQLGIRPCSARVIPGRRAGYRGTPGDRSGTVQAHSSRIPHPSRSVPACPVPSRGGGPPFGSPVTVLYKPGTPTRFPGLPGARSGGPVTSRCRRAVTCGSPQLAAVRCGLSTDYVRTGRFT